MVKFTADKKDGILIGFGLSEENIKRLKAGNPIAIHMKELNLPSNDEILIFYGETEGDIIEKLGKHIGPNTTIHSKTQKGWTQ